MVSMPRANPARSIRWEWQELSEDAQDTDILIHGIMCITNLTNDVGRIKVF